MPGSAGRSSCRAEGTDRPYARDAACHADARAMFERLLDLRNDLGLLAEEYDPRARRQVGNFPQAFSHVALINTAHNLTRAYGSAQHRAESEETAGPGALRPTR